MGYIWTGFLLKEENIMQMFFFLIWCNFILKLYLKNENFLCDVGTYINIESLAYFEVLL